MRAGELVIRFPLHLPEGKPQAAFRRPLLEASVLSEWHR